MKYSEIKQLKELVGDVYIDAINEAKEENDDFTLSSSTNGPEYRFILDSKIDTIMQDELASDEYILGCFNDWFLADVLSIDIDVIQAMQKAEAFEAIGKLVISLDKVEELQAAYSQADGYGHHFSHYDFSEEEMLICGHDYHVFRVN